MSIADHYQPFRLARNLGIPANGRDINADAFNVKWSAGAGKYLVVAGGDLIALSFSDANQLSMVTLVGQPTGVFEMKIANGLIMGAHLFAPLSVYDTTADALTTIDYDFARRMEQQWFYSKPYAVLRFMRAIATIDLKGELTFHAASPDTDAGLLPPSQRLDIQNPVAMCFSENGSRAIVTGEDGRIALFQRDEISKILQLVEKIKVPRHVGFLFKIGCDRQAQAAAIADSLTNNVFLVSADSHTIRLTQTLSEVPKSSS